jgi:DNA-binding IscR family transcriptional regulator
VERPLVLMDCLERGTDYCSYCSVCTQKSIWEEAQKVLADFLGRISINDIADRQGLRGRLVGAPLQKAI